MAYTVTIYGMEGQSKTTIFKKIVADGWFPNEISPLVRVLEAEGGARIEIPLKFILRFSKERNANI